MDWPTATFVGGVLVALGIICLLADKIDQWANRDDNWPPRRRHK